MADSNAPLEHLLLERLPGQRPLLKLLQHHISHGDAKSSQQSDSVAQWLKHVVCLVTAFAHIAHAAHDGVQRLAVLLSLSCLECLSISTLQQQDR